MGLGSAQVPEDRGVRVGGSGNVPAQAERKKGVIAVSKENFNFVDVAPLLRAQPRMEEIPEGQIRVSGFMLYLPTWMIKSKHRKHEHYSLLIDQEKKVLLIKPGVAGMYLFTRKTKSGLTLPGIFRSKRLIRGLMGLKNEPTVFSCEWNAQLKGFAVDFGSPLASD